MTYYISAKRFYFENKIKEGGYLAVVDGRFGDWSENVPEGAEVLDYGDEPYKRLSEEEIRFQCDCSKERFMNALASLPAKDLQEMKDEDHGAEITCQFCQTTYHFDENDLEELIRDKS